MGEGGSGRQHQAGIATSAYRHPCLFVASHPIRASGGYRDAVTIAIMVTKVGSAQVEDEQSSHGDYHRRVRRSFDKEYRHQRAISKPTVARTRNVSSPGLIGIGAAIAADAPRACIGMGGANPESSVIHITRPSRRPDASA